jgi:hypothetical protein
VALVSLAAFGALLAPSVRAEFAAAAPSAAPAPLPEHTRRTVRADAGEARQWRVGHHGRDEMHYEELRDGRWERIPISGEMLMGRAHHVVYFASPREWLAYPEWARHRRDEIVARVKSEFRPPDYEYVDDGPAAAAAAPLPSPVSHAQWRALGIAIALLLAIAGGTALLVQRGLTRGETWLPMPHASQRRVVTRADEPATFWLAIGFYAAAAAGTVGLSGWLAREAVRLRSSAARSG